MKIGLKCKSCNSLFRVDFLSNEFELSRCPTCGAIIHDADIARIRSITEPVYTNVPRLLDVKLSGIFVTTEAEKGHTRNASVDTMFSDDLKSLEEVFSSSTVEAQGLLTAMLDKFYLLVNHDAAANNTQGLERTLKKLSTMFYDMIKEKWNESESQFQ